MKFNTHNVPPHNADYPWAAQYHPGDKGTNSERGSKADMMEKQNELLRIADPSGAYFVAVYDPSRETKKRRHMPPGAHSQIPTLCIMVMGTQQNTYRFSKCVTAMTGPKAGQPLNEIDHLTLVDLMTCVHQENRNITLDELSRMADKVAAAFKCDDAAKNLAVREEAEGRFFEQLGFLQRDPQSVYVFKKQREQAREIEGLKAAAEAEKAAKEEAEAAKKAAEAKAEAEKAAAEKGKTGGASSDPTPPAPLADKPKK